VSIFSTATTPAVREPSQPVRDLPQDIRLRHRPRWSNGSRGRIPTVGGIFIQMEDELAASIAITGAVWGGAKAFTVTSGPGFSLMMEHIGYAAITETPCVFVNVQRGGPSTGLPTLPAQADMMQARWGSHGDYSIVALCPNSPQECFDLTVTAFNIAEEFRVPVMMMLDECVGHMTEKVVIPEAEKIAVMPRRFTKKPPEEFRLFEPVDAEVPEMVKAGDGYRFHVTGLTHDERGYPSMTVDTQDRLIRRLADMLKPLAGARAIFQAEDLEDAEVVVVSYGITSRVAQRALQMVREQGIKAGKFRIISAWPFPEEHIASLADRVKAFVVPEPGATITAEDVREYVRENLARFKVPRDVEFVDELPRNATGKVVKRSLQ